MSRRNSLSDKIENRALEILYECTLQGRELAWEFALSKAVAEDWRKKAASGRKVRLF